MKKMKVLGKQVTAVALSIGLLVSALPPGLVLAGSVKTVYAAAWKNAGSLTDTTLPESVEVNGTPSAVTWNLDAIKKANPFDTVDVTGTAGGSKVGAQVEVLPEKENSLVYFVDAGRDGKESKAFDAVAKLANKSLMNQKPDQKKEDTTTWGRVGENFKEKSVGNLDETKKIQTGWYSASKSEPLTYVLTLKPGTYTITTGFYEWWNNRSMKVALSGKGMDTVTSETAAISGVGDSKVISTGFTVKTEGQVTMQVQNATGGEAPVISWFAVNEGKTEEKKADTDIVVKGSDVESAAKNVNGLTFKGFGLLSANSTSNLLLDYKSQSPETYQKMLQVLFGGDHPLMNHVKIEMGNDGNNSTGSDACTMRSEQEEADVSRSPGFVLAGDAKKVNSKMKVSILRWKMPTWAQDAWTKDRAGAGFDAVYKWYKESIFDAYEKYGYIVDYVNPDWNETWDPDGEFIKWFKSRVQKESNFPSYMDQNAQDAYKSIKIIASDENTSLNIVPEMRADKDLYNAVDAIGFHYSTGTDTSTTDYRTMADKDDKEVWYSEGCATFSYSEYQKNKTSAYGAKTIGGYQSPLALADNFIKSFVYSRKTHYIFQPAIGSFYEGAQYDHKELLSAREPWAGYVHYDPAIYLLQHYAMFAKTGWENSKNTEGIWRAIAAASSNGSTGTEHIKNEAGKPSYMTLASPDKKDFSVIIVNNSEKTLTYSIKAEDMQLLHPDKMELWESKTDSYMKYKGNITRKEDHFVVTVEPFSMVTATTLACNGKEGYGERLPEEVKKTVLDTDAAGKAQDTSNDTLYADDYEYKDYDKEYLKSRGFEPRYTVDLSGAFVCRDGALKQVLNEPVQEWISNKPNCTIGDFRWMDYKANVDVTIPEGGFAGINIRQQTGMNFEGSGYNLQIKRDGTWAVKKHDTVITTGEVKANETGSYQLALEGKGAYITAWIDGKQITCYKDPNPEYFGRVRLGCDWKETSFDNLLIKKVKGHTSYADELLDNCSDQVSYSNGNWDIIAGGGGGSNDWYRSTSTSKASGASFTFAFKGTGFSLIGKNNGDAKLDVVIDGKQAAKETATAKSNNHYSTYEQNHLENKSHTATVTVKSGTLVLDAIQFFTEGITDKGELESVIHDSEKLTQDGYTDASWKAMTDALNEAKKVDADPSATQENIDNALYELTTKVAGLMSGDTVVGVETISIASEAGNKPNLPTTIQYTLANGSTKQVAVTWNVPNLEAYQTVKVDGVVTEDGRKVSATIEVIPAHTLWFIDSGIDVSKQTTTVPFNAVKELLKDKLQNDKADQEYKEGATSWGYTAEDVGLKSQEGMDMTDKTASGIYALGHGDTSRPITYTLPLKAGNYQIAAGFKEWWNVNRNMKLSAVWTDSLGNHEEPLGEEIKLSATNLTKNATGKITLNEDVNVQIKVTMTSGADAPVISWLIVNRITADKTALEQEIKNAETINSTEYTKESYASVADALKAAKVVDANEAATEKEVADAVTTLKNAVSALEKAKPEEIIVPITKINVRGGNQLTLMKGDKKTISATVEPQNTTMNKKLRWTSSNQKVATVTNKGVVSAKGAGKTTITITASNGVKAKVKVTVKQVKSNVIKGTRYQVSWHKQKKAAGYWVYRSLDGRNYSMVAELSGNKNTKFEQVLSGNRNAKYKVKAYYSKKNKKKVIGWMKVQVKKKKHCIKASYWNLSGYKRYAIEMRTKTRKGYKAWKQVKSVSGRNQWSIDYVLTGAKYNTTYQFRLIGYNGKQRKVLKA